MVLSRDELKTKLLERLKDQTDDETLSLLEDITDTLSDGTDWEAKYKELDEGWRKRYAERFYGGADEDAGKGVEVVAERVETEDSDMEIIEESEASDVTFADIYEKEGDK